MKEINKKLAIIQQKLSRITLVKVGGTETQSNEKSLKEHVKLLEEVKTKLKKHLISQNMTEKYIEQIWIYKKCLPIKCVN